MRKTLLALTIGLAALAAGCNKADDSLKPLITPEAANLEILDFSSSRVPFTTTDDCATIPAPADFNVQVVNIEARVQWLANATCVGGVTPRQCAPGNLNAGDACTVNSDCDLTVMDDGAGTCSAKPCNVDSDCTVRQCAVGNLNAGDACTVNSDCDLTVMDDGAGTCSTNYATCGSVSSRLVFASTVVDPQNKTEKGVILFDNGDDLVPLNDDTGNPTIYMVKTGDQTNRDLVYTRKFAVLTTSVAPIEECVAQGLELSSMPYTPKGIPMTFRIDAIDAVTGAARLTSATTITSITSEATCCKYENPAGSGNIQEFCSSTSPICS